MAPAPISPTPRNQAKERSAFSAMKTSAEDGDQTTDSLVESGPTREASPNYDARWK
jgi:hypothetical protein